MFTPRLNPVFLMGLSSSVRTAMRYQASLEFTNMGIDIVSADTGLTVLGVARLKGDTNESTIAPWNNNQHASFFRMPLSSDRITDRTQVEQ